MTDRLLVYYDDLRRLAESKCASREEAEDLVSETFLAAYAYIRRGGVIEYPKTYLANTLMHKRNSLLRKAYRRPPVVSLDTLEAVPEDIVDESSDEDAAGAAQKDSLFVRDDQRSSYPSLFQRVFDCGHRQTDRYPCGYRQKPPFGGAGKDQGRMDETDA